MGKTLKKYYIWIICWIAIVSPILVITACWVVKIDPFFHYHYPLLDEYYYTLDGERNVNDGISRHFYYDTIITGSSMVENFKPSECDEIYGCRTVKLPYSGATYKEINDSLKRALNSKNDINMIIRGMDWLYMQDKDLMRSDMGSFPKYLYDDNPFNDVEYLFNRDIIFARVYRMCERSKENGFVPGIDSFDSYAAWQYPYGRDNVLSNDYEVKEFPVQEKLTEEEKRIVYGNITQNVTSLTDEYQDVDFYYFITPYSIVYWKKLLEDGDFEKMTEAEELTIELMLQHKNIHVYSFNMMTDITTNLNNYKDIIHYGPWINTLILQWMHDGEGLITQENYKEYIEAERAFYSNYDYNSLIDQEDYEDDYVMEEKLLGHRTNNND